MADPPPATPDASPVPSSTPSPRMFGIPASTGIFASRRSYGAINDTRNCVSGDS